MIDIKVKFTVEFTSLIDNSKSILSTVINFEDRIESIYYSYNFKDNSGNILGGKSQPISKETIDTNNELEFLIKHATYSIDNFRVRRKRIFKVIDTVLL